MPAGFGMGGNASASSNGDHAMPGMGGNGMPGMPGMGGKGMPGMGGMGGKGMPDFSKILSDPEMLSAFQVNLFI